MSWGLGWNRPSDIFHLTLTYGTEDPPEPPAATSSSASSASSSSSVASLVSQADHETGFRVDLDWSACDDEDQVALRLESQLVAAMPMPQDTVFVDLRLPEEDDEARVSVDMRVVRRREPLRAVSLAKTVGSGHQNDGTGVLTRLLRSDFSSASSMQAVAGGEEACGFAGLHWQCVTVLRLCGCGLIMFPVELIKLPRLEKLYLDNNKLAVLPAELAEVKNLKVLVVDYNLLTSVPVELRQCVGLVELSLEHNKLIRPLLDFRAMAELRVLRLFGNPLEFLPEILPLHKLHHLTLANMRIVADDSLRSVNVQIETENSSYFGASRHKLSAFFALIFRFSSCHHPLLASALAKIMQDEGNRVVVGKDENAVRQLISMISSENRHVVQQACSALSSIAADVSFAMQLIKVDIMQPIETVLRSGLQEEVISVLQVVVKLAFATDAVAQKMLTKDVLNSLKNLCAHRTPEVQRLALLAVGNLAFCLENRRLLVTSESLCELLMRLAGTPEPRVNKAAARALAILGENGNLRCATRGRQVPKQGLRILSMDGGGMKGLATVQILKAIEKGTGKQIHELFDLICGTSTGGMLAVALGIKLMSLDQCEEIYKNLGKLVFAEPAAKDNEVASWREKLDQIYKSSSQSFRVVVHGSKHSADHFERLLKEMCADEDGDLLIESAVKSIPKVFVVSTLVSMTPAQPFLFRNYQYPVGTPELGLVVSENSGITVQEPSSLGTELGYRRSAFMGSCKHQVWQAIRASSAAPYYLDDFSIDIYRWQDGAIVANNPTIFAIREAQLLWPDTKIDCLVSIGCGSVPTKVRKGGWRYLDTGQVLIESSCSVDRVEEALSTLLPMLPGIQYFRFNPVDERCDMELDETDPAVWLKLEASMEEYIQKSSVALKNACERLLMPFQTDKSWSENFRSQHSPKENEEVRSPSLGWRRSVLLVEASHSPNSRRALNHAHELESFCARNGIRVSLMQGVSGFVKTTPATTFPTPFQSPLVPANVPSSPLFYSPDFGPQRVDRIDMIPPLSLDGQPGKGVVSPPKSIIPRPRQLSVPVQSLHDKLQTSAQVGIVHLALQNDSTGSILSWQNDVFVVAEPGELADNFLQSVKLSLLSIARNHRKKAGSFLPNISTVSDLVAYKPCFQLGCITHRYMGRQTQVMEDGQEIGAYMFRRTVPSIHLTPDDVRWMVGAWRERIIICTGTNGPTPTLVKAFLDSGAKAVIASSVQPQETQFTFGSTDFSVLEKFEIGEEDAEEDEVEDEAAEPGSSASDWEDIENENRNTSSRDEDEEEVSQFICQLYDSLFREGASVDVALRHALASHRKLRYKCHLPS